MSDRETPTEDVAAHLERALALLDRVGAVDVEHPSGTLLEHLRGTHDVLARWGCPGHLCLAGLYHSVYGTEVFTTQTVSLEERDMVRAAAGVRAEALAFLYCAVRRSSMYESLERGGPHWVETTEGTVVHLDGLEQLSELLTLDLANRIEQLPRHRLGSIEEEHTRRIYERAAPFLPQRAVLELRETFPRRSDAELLVRRLVRAGRRILRSQRSGHGSPVVPAKPR